VLRGYHQDVVEYKAARAKVRAIRAKAAPSLADLTGAIALLERFQ
jgi:hypothetical protein